MTTLWDQLITSDSATAIRNRLIGYAQTAKLSITSWIVGDVGQQILESVIAMVQAYSAAASTITRGYASLDTARDPGDEDPFDPTNASKTPAAGFLSNLGRSVHGTTRGEATFASGFVLFVNAGASARTFAPGGLTFTWTANSPPDPAPTYVNAPDDTIYATGTVTVAAGSSLLIPVVAQEEGAFASCPSGSLSLTTTMLGCSATNPAAVVGSDRESVNVYVSNCRKASARLSFAGPSDAFAYFASKDLDGNPLLNAVGNQVGITRAQVVGDSTTGIMTCYFASDAGAAIADDVTAANTNIEKEIFAIGDCITYTGQAATADSLHVVGIAKIKYRAGLSLATVKQGIVAALAAAGKTIPVGGHDQVAGAGKVYTSDLEGVARTGYAGLYDVEVTTPASTYTPIGAGHVPVIVSAVSDWTVSFT